MIYKATLTWKSKSIHDDRHGSRTYFIDDSHRDFHTAADILFDGNNTDHLYIYIDFWEAKGWSFTVTFVAVENP